MSKRVLSVFIDESGDFGSYEVHSPYYLVSLILHNQSDDISNDINLFDSHLLYLGHKSHAIHTGPLIRRESTYKNDLIEDRKHLFNALFNFARRLPFLYFCIKVKKSECPDVISMAAKIELLAEKITHYSFSKSERDFFDNVRDFKKNYLKHIRKKLL